MSIHFNRNNSIDLSTLIKKEISYRILACFLLALVSVLTITLIEVGETFHQSEKKFEEKCKNLEKFIISQFLNQNQEAIQFKLDALKEKNNSTRFIWQQHIKEIYLQQKMQWQFPLSWKYVFPVHNIDKSFLGNIEVTGSFLDIQEDLLKKILLLLIFFITIFIVLFPLNKRIPQRLFVAPVNNLIALLDNQNTSEELIQSLPVEIEEIKNKIISLLKNIEAKTRGAALGQIATQVAHDIRSPLTVLNIETKGLSFLPEKNRINIKNAIQRVNDIANNLLSQYKNNNNITTENAVTSEFIFMILESVVSEKRIEIKATQKQITLDVAPEAYNAFININISDFKRVFSNIINNAIEAIGNNGNIIVKLTKNHGKVLINIIDNGCGISSDKISFITKEGVSFGKINGSGLGLSYAVNKIHAWGGEYKIDSVLGKGTCFSIIFPESRQPDWFMPEINIMENSTIVILDDDDFMHQEWDERFTKLFIHAHDIAVTHFNNPNDLIHSYEKFDLKNTLFLFDYELKGYKETGLILAEKFNLGQRAILVTNRYEDPTLRVHCQKIGMKIISKLIVKYIPICIVKKSNIVLIDDDELITTLWKESARQEGIKLSVFNKASDFMKIYHLFEKDIFIYIDSSLQDSVKGEDIGKVLYDKGYINIILVTGFPKTHFSNMYWLKNIIGKTPPWVNTETY